MSLAIKPLRPEPTPAFDAPVDPLAEAVRDVIANAEREVVAAMRARVAAQTVAEAMTVGDCRDTIEAVPLSLLDDRDTDTDAHDDRVAAERGVVPLRRPGRSALR